MQLFKTLLGSFFPPELLGQQLSPIRMMLGVLSPKQYFNYVTRRIADNYKLNLSDIGLESYIRSVSPFTGQYNISPTDVESFFGYAAAAHLNGHRCWQPDCIATVTALCLTCLSKSSFNTAKKTNNHTRVAFTLTIYFVVFLFVARVKTFPHQTKKENYNRFIELFRNFFSYIREIQSKKIYEIDHTFVQTDLYVALFEICVYVQNYLSYERFNKTDFFQRLCTDSRQQGVGKSVITEFIAHHDETQHSNNVSTVEKVILKTVFPKDILIKHLFQAHAQSGSIIDYLLCTLFPPQKTIQKITQLKEQEITTHQFIASLLNHERFAKSYIDGSKKLASQLFADLDDPSEDREEIVQQIQSGEIDVSSIDLPDRMKKESALFEHLINFYLTFMGRLFTAKGDGGQLRLKHRESIVELTSLGQEQMKKDSLAYYGSLLANYATNVMHYKTFYGRKASAKKSFSYLSNSVRHIYANSFLVQMIHEQGLITALGDLSPKPIRLLIKNTAIIESFKEIENARIAEILDNDAVIGEKVYNPLFGILGTNFSDSGLRITKNQVKALKESLYTPDFHARHRALLESKKNSYLGSHHTKWAQIVMAATLRETLWGGALLFRYVHNRNEKNANSEIKNMIANRYEILITHIPGQSYLHDIQLLPWMDRIYGDLADERLLLDENKRFMSIIHGIFATYLKTASEQEEASQGPSSKQFIRYLSVCKHITYYNKRYCIPPVL